MKTLAKCLSISFYFFLLLNCGKSNDIDNRVANTQTVKAAIGVTCGTTINFEDLEDNVYAYRADAFFATPSVQAGGHSTIDESTDLGVNFFFDLANLSNMNYAITNATGITGSAYVFYINSGVEFISTENNTENLVVQALELNEDGDVTRLVCSFNNIEVANNMDPGDLLCINAFELIFNL